MFLNIPTSLSESDDIINETINNIIIEIYTMIAQQEYDTIQRRCKEGRDALKAKGEWHKYGRPRLFTKDEFAKHYNRVIKKEIGSLALMRELGFKKDTYFSYVKEYKDNQKCKQILF